MLRDDDDFIPLGFMDEHTVLPNPHREDHRRELALSVFYIRREVDHLAFILEHLSAVSISSSKKQKKRIGTHWALHRYGLITPRPSDACAKIETHIDERKVVH